MLLNPTESSQCPSPWHICTLDHYLLKMHSLVGIWDTDLFFFLPIGSWLLPYFFCMLFLITLTSKLCCVLYLSLDIDFSLFIHSVTSIQCQSFWYHLYSDYPPYFYLYPWLIPWTPDSHVQPPDIFTWPLNKCLTPKIFKTELLVPVCCLFLPLKSYLSSQSSHLKKSQFRPSHCSCSL